MDTRKDKSGTCGKEVVSPAIVAGIESPSGVIRDRHIEMIAVNKLNPNRANARTHSRKQIRQIADCIKRFGFNNPVLVDDYGEIIAGHGRVEAAKLLGLTELPTLRLRHLSPAEKRAYVIADNRLAELAGWDGKILAIELQGLLDLNFEVELTGFDMGTIDIILNDADEPRAESADDPEDEIPEPTAGPAVSQAGDLWILGEHRLLCGDARGEGTYRKLLDVDVAIRSWQNYSGKSATLAGTSKTFEEIEKERSALIWSSILRAIKRRRQIARRPDVQV